MNVTGTNRGTILIVDDDPGVLVLIQTILMAADYRVLRLARQKHIHIDIVLLDVRIPGVSGTELADEILSIRPDLRVLWMSGFVHEEFIRIKMLDGYAGFLSKPFRRDGLLLAVQRAMEGAPRIWETPGDDGLMSAAAVPGVAQTIVVCRLRSVVELGRPRKTMACPTARLPSAVSYSHTSARRRSAAGNPAGLRPAARWQHRHTHRPKANGGRIGWVCAAPVRSYPQPAWHPRSG